MANLETQIEQISLLLKKIYKDHSEQKINSVLSQLIQILHANNPKKFNDQKITAELWDSSTAVLITYADVVSQKEVPSFKTLNHLVNTHLEGLVSVIHVLPFLNSTSDGGFAVSSYEKVEPRFGSWEDLKDLSKNHVLMADLVLNHVSASHPWIHQFVQSKEPGSSYVLEPSPLGDWTNVIRPRDSALFTLIKKNNELVKVWTTFGPDQIDLNWHEPEILIEFLQLIVRYVDSGVKWIRLDAVGFIWKESGTSCLHRKEVHEIVKLIRLLVNNLTTKSVLITETNVPEKENISYLLDGNEAHLVYNFSLPPLLLEALITNKADWLNKWLDTWTELTHNTGFLNFTASHDGIGLRPLEGLMDQERIHALLIACESRGGMISHRRIKNGEQKPYELNISWWSAMEDSGNDKANFQIERFLLSQLFIMSLKGVPAFYLQSILASENDLYTFGVSGKRRDINRHKFKEEEILSLLKDKNSNAAKNLRFLKHAIKVRSKLNAFHPNEKMTCLSKNSSNLVVICRGHGEQKVWAVHNMTNSALRYFFPQISRSPSRDNNIIWKDCLSNQIFKGTSMELKPYSVNWLMIIGNDHA